MLGDFVSGQRQAGRAAKFQRNVVNGTKRHKSMSARMSAFWE